MELSPDLLRAAEARYGTPREAFFEVELLPWEMDLIERVCGETRFHDLTTFVMDGSALALVHKPSEPEGVYWAPAGGLHEGEQVDQGVRREVREETGVDVVVDRYLLRLEALFNSGGRTRPWTSHVFLAHPRRPVTERLLFPEDTKEVEKAAWVDLDTFRVRTLPVLCGTGWGRFRYRAHMAELAFAELGLEFVLDCVGPDHSDNTAGGA